MKKFLSEKTIVSLLFILVLVIFSFAHEYSKRINEHYNTLTPKINVDHASASVIKLQNNIVSSVKQIQ
jgi:hypothetical protein